MGFMSAVSCLGMPSMQRCTFLRRSQNLCWPQRIGAKVACAARPIKPCLLQRKQGPSPVVDIRGLPGRRF
jgi:hypothetical protein